jgi:hypothetical protein
MVKRDMIVMAKSQPECQCGGEEEGNMLLRRTRRSTYNNRGPCHGVNVLLSKGRDCLTFDHESPHRMRHFETLKSLNRIALSNRNVRIRSHDSSVSRCHCL